MTTRINLWNAMRATARRFTDRDSIIQRIASSWILFALSGAAACHTDIWTSNTVTPVSKETKTTSASNAQPGPSVSAQSPIDVLGAFSNVKVNGEHAYGFTLTLWRQGDVIFGLFSVQNGLFGDPPLGIIGDVHFDNQTQSLSFSTSLSTGITYNKEYNGVPSKDVYGFIGKLKRDKVTGTLSHSDMLFPDRSSEKYHVVLKRSDVLSEVMEVPPSFAEWKGKAVELVKLRQPK